MKLNLYKAASWAIASITSFSAAFSLQGCKEGDESMKWVDLRYRVENSYLLEAKNPEEVSFIVKSSAPWEVYGNEDWNTISPNKGEASEKYTVTITCKENTGLDDRTDTIHIKSDYWIGKKFLLTQKGIAYLNIEGVNRIKQEGSTETFSVLSNQKWTAEVTEGDFWLSIEKGKSGEQNGEISVKAEANAGEQRSGYVTVYDRHGKVAKVVECIQNGVLLSPQAPENGKWFAIYEQAQQLVIPVESNAEWEVRKDNEADEDWYEFEKTSFSGNENIVINISKHIGSRVRTGTIVLVTKAVEGATQLVKTIKFKQANPKIPVVTAINKTITESYYGPSGLMPGRYNFYYESFIGNSIQLFFLWGAVELRYHIVNNKTDLGTAPWCADVFSGHGAYVIPVDGKKLNVLSLEIQEKKDPKDPNKSWMYNEWILNDKVIAKATSDGISDGDGTDDTWKITFDKITVGGSFLIRSQNNSSVVVSKYEYIAPLVWGD